MITGDFNTEVDRCNNIVLLELLLFIIERGLWRKLSKAIIWPFMFLLPQNIYHVREAGLDYFYRELCQDQSHFLSTQNFKDRYLTAYFHNST